MIVGPSDGIAGTSSRTIVISGWRWSSLRPVDCRSSISNRDGVREGYDCRQLREARLASEQRAKGLLLLLDAISETATEEELRADSRAVKVQGGTTVDLAGVPALVTYAAIWPHLRRVDIATSAGRATIDVEIAVME